MESRKSVKQDSCECSSEIEEGSVGELKGVGRFT